MKSARLVSLSLVALAGSAAAPSLAETYVVGVENIEYLPQYTFRDGEYGGFARELLDAFAREKGHTFEYRALPVARLFSDLVNLQIDLKYPDNEKWSTEMKSRVSVVYSAPVVAYVDGVNVTPERVGKGVAELKVLGAVRGFTPWDWLGPIKAGAVKLQENNSFQALLVTAIRRRVDGAYGNVAVVARALDRELNLPGALVFDPGLAHTKSHYHLSTVKHPKLIAEFDAWMAANGGEVAAMKAKYEVEKGVE